MISIYLKLLSPSKLSAPLSLCDIPTIIFFVKAEGEGRG
jgi:hypothetical protein